MIREGLALFAPPTFAGLAVMELDRAGFYWLSWAFVAVFFLVVMAALIYIHPPWSSVSAQTRGEEG